MWHQRQVPEQMCGTTENSDSECGPRGNRKLPLAHLAPRAGYFQSGFARRFDVNSPRNFILLCGSHGKKGTCHDGFDSHKLALVPAVKLRQAQRWKVLHNYCGWKASNSADSHLQLHDVTFDKFNPDMVYKRALATRLNKFVLDNGRALRDIPGIASMTGAVRDLSMTESLRGQRDSEAEMDSVFPSAEVSQAPVPQQETAQDAVLLCHQESFSKAEQKHVADKRLFATASHAKSGGRCCGCDKQACR